MNSLQRLKFLNKTRFPLLQTPQTRHNQIKNDRNNSKRKFIFRGGRRRTRGGRRRRRRGLVFCKATVLESILKEREKGRRGEREKGKKRKRERGGMGRKCVRRWERIGKKKKKNTSLYPLILCSFLLLSLSLSLSRSLSLLSSSSLSLSNLSSSPSPSFLFPLFPNHISLQIFNKCHKV